LYYELQKSKRGKKCNMGGCFINKEDYYFSTTEFNKDFPYPIKKSICIKCCEHITNDDFIARLKNTLTLCLNLKEKTKAITRPKQEPPF
jgi:hypothetical protein